jgi:ABC-type glycerol-3-phosphate transport system substrate-binding protein
MGEKYFSVSGGEIKMKKILCVFLWVLLIVNLWAGGQRAGGKQTVIMLVQGNSNADAYKQIAANYTKTHPGFELDITAIDGVTEFNTALTAKIAARDMPDIVDLQWDTNITKYAQNGYLLALDDMGLADKLVNIQKKINVVSGKTYAYPTVQSLWGMFWNQNLAKKYGVDYIPKTMPQVLDALGVIRRNGLEYPYLTPGMDLSGATTWIMAYLHQQISGQDPLFYYKICTGEKSWNGPEIRQLYDVYRRQIEFASKDIMGVDPEEFRRRFAREEVVYCIQGTGWISSLRQANPNFDFILAPSSAILDEKNYCVISDFNNGLVISADTKNIALVQDFYKYCFEPVSSEIYTTILSGVSPVKNAHPKYDRSIESNLPFLESGNFVGFSERDWIPGIRDILKKNTQDWMSGALTLDETLNNLQAEHQRLLNASPNYINEYRTLLQTIGLLK